MTAADRAGAAIAPPIAYSDHLVALVARAQAAAAVLAEADPDRRARVVAGARRDAALLSARLDASPLTEATADEVDRRLAAGQPPVDDIPRPSTPGTGWQRALAVDAMAAPDVAAVEYANLLACFDAEPPLAAVVFEDPMAALRALHATLCAGLVEPDVIGRWRQTGQAIHDGAQGTVIYHAPAPEMVPALLDRLATWLGDASATLPDLVVAGVVHERLLEWQPFEAANGRLARAFSRLLLRARGLDVHGAAVPERLLAADPLGYFGEVAATIRRRGDLVGWLERWGQAACVALEHAAAIVRPGPPVTPPARALHVAGSLPPGGTVTLAEYAGIAGVRRETARADVIALERAGALALDPGARGLRWRRREP